MSAGGIVFNIAKSQMMDGSLDLDTDVLKVMLCMTNNSLKTNTSKDADSLGHLTTGKIDEFDNATGYTAGGEVLTGTGVTVDDANDRGELDATDSTWTGVAAGTRKISGGLLYKVTGGIPIAYFSFSTSFAANGGDITINWSAQGLLHVTD